MRKALLIGMTLVAGCTTSGTDAEILQGAAQSLQELELTSGTSFGMCAGYCRTELTIDSLLLTLTELSEGGRGAQPLPDRTRTLPLELAEWKRVRSLVDAAALKRLEGVHGCPDCADGGAEWIQIGAGKDSVRVTFQYGDTLTGIAPLQIEIRALRDRFPR
jgi:hypothetical protein